MKISSKLRREDGAAAVEFAIIVSLLVMLVFGMMQYGLAFFQTQNLRSAVREGARVAAVRGDASTVKAAIASASAGSLTTGNFSYTQSATCDDSNVGDEVTITIPYASLPQSMKDQFSINIPFGPTVQLKPNISGSFRCE
ncbi:MAG: TadE-like protein [Actinomycetota bacterium]|jgi:Flp pilus assembly protein TadG|nr:TadE-like protein [Actinomycetota bacterium]